MTDVQVAPHPLLDLVTLAVELPRRLAEIESPESLRRLLGPSVATPLATVDAAVRAAVRDLLRHGGFKPTGRSKPSAEYLAKAAADGRLGSINLLVDIGNAVSLHSGLPISVVDLDRTPPPLRVEIAAPGASFVFNSSGQVIDVGGLIGLADAHGPCANPVKDAVRTKTAPDTRRALYLLWGPRLLGDRVLAAAQWCRELVREHATEAA